MCICICITESVQQKFSLSLLQRIFPNQESTQGFLHCRWILYQLSYQGRGFKQHYFKKKKKSHLPLILGVQFHGAME